MGCLMACSWTWRLILGDEGVCVDLERGGRGMEGMEGDGRGDGEGGDPCLYASRDGYFTTS